MKWRMGLATLALVVGISACKKDKNPPTITISGANPAEVAVGGGYTDAGATATDADGTVSVVTDNSQINTAATGSFNILYSATNDHGTTKKSRAVNVIIDQSVYLGSYSITDDCSPTQFPIKTSPTITAGATANDLVMDDFFALLNGTVNATIDGQDITVPQQTVSVTGGAIELNGTGTMNAAGTEMIITYNYNNTIQYAGGTGTCTATYTKQ